MTPLYTELKKGWLAATLFADNSRAKLSGRNNGGERPLDRQQLGFMGGAHKGLHIHYRWWSWVYLAEEHSRHVFIIHLIPGSHEFSCETSLLPSNAQ
jgi:hypothetical protein